MFGIFQVIFLHGVGDVGYEGEWSLLEICLLLEKAGAKHLISVVLENRFLTRNFSFLQRRYSNNWRRFLLLMYRCFRPSRVQHVTLNMDMPMTTCKWIERDYFHGKGSMEIGFDIINLDQNTKEDQKGIEESSNFCKFCFVFIKLSPRMWFISVNHLVEEEINHGIAPERIVSMIIVNTSLFSLVDHRWFFHVSSYSIIFLWHYFDAD